MKKGILVAIDGPNASGKSTIIKQVYGMLIRDGYNVLVEKEPTNTPLGVFCKENADSISGKSLAYLVAADRLEHSKRISCLLHEYDIILLDRYYFSSLIFQCIDGVSKDEVNQINEGILMPNIQIVIRASQELLRERLSTRKKGDRFERNNSSQEVRFTEEGIQYFRQNHQNIMLCIVESSSILHNDGSFDNSISVYNIIKGYSHHV